METLKMARQLNLNRLFIFLAVFFMMISFSACGFSQEWNRRDRWQGNANIILGCKKLEESDWEPLDEHKSFGFDADLRYRRGALGINMGYLRSYAEEEFSGRDWESKTSELYAGVKKIIDKDSKISLFISGGLSLIHAEIEEKYDFLNSETSDDEAFGFWFGGGIYLTFIKQINVGLNIRYSYSEVSLFNKEFDAGGLHYGLLCGYSF